MPHVAVVPRLRTAVASLSVTIVVLSGATALSAPASAAPVAAPAATSVAAPVVAPVVTSAGAIRAPARASATTAPTARVLAAIQAQAYINDVLRRVNAQRTARGLRPLKADYCAYRYASAQNGLLVRVGALSHQNLGRVMRGCAARGAGENVAYGNVSSATLMGMWMGSPGHRANILRPGFTHIGISATRTASGRWYATQVFLTR